MSEKQTFISKFFMRVLSPWGFFVAAVVAVCPFLLLHGLGMRSYASVLCGNMSDGNSFVGGLAYVGFYCVAVLLAPIFLLTVVFLEALCRMERRVQDDA